MKTFFTILITLVLDALSGLSLWYGITGLFFSGSKGSFILGVSIAFLGMGLSYTFFSKFSGFENSYQKNSIFLIVLCLVFGLIYLYASLVS
jgi:hypothetical protein